MSITAAELILYGSASMPDDDTSTNIGGAIDTTTRIAFSDMVVTDKVSVKSDNAADNTQTVTVYGRNAGGTIINEVLTLNGTTLVNGATTFQRILKVVISAAHAGNITLQDQQSTPNVLATIESGVLQLRRLFYNASADVTGGATKKYYDKVFFKNTDATLDLTSASVIEQADPSGDVAFALESTLAGTDTNGAGNNRQVAPTGYTFNSTTKSVANSGTLTHGSEQGIWLELTLAAGAAAQNTTYTPRLSGTTT